MYDGTEDMPAPQDTVSLETVPPKHSIPEHNSEASTKYSEDPNPYCDIAVLQEHFQQH